MLEKTIKNAGAANELYGQSIEHLLEKEARLKGFTDEELAQGFLRLVSATHDSKKAFEDLQLAEDISRARHLQLTSAALALTKAEQGSVTALTRLGIVVPKVSEAVSALTKQHDALLASGVKFTKAQENEFKAHLAVAQAADDRARRVSALAIVQQRFGGAATTFAETAAGKAERVLGQSLHQLEVALGSALLPALASAATSLGHFFDEMTASGKAAATAHSVVSQLADAFHVLGDVVHIVAPPIGLIARGLVAIAQEVGGGNIIAVAVAMKAFGIAAALAGAAQTRLNAVFAIYRGEQVAVVAAKEADTVATAANTAALVANAEAATVAAGAQLRLGGATAVATGAFRAEAAAGAAATVAQTGAAARGAATGFRALAASALGLANPMQTLVVTGTAAAIALRHVISATKAAQDVADEAISHVGTKRAEALSYYTRRVEALVKDGMDRIKARALAEEQTFEHLGVRIRAATGGAGAGAPDSPESLKAQLAASKTELAAIASSIATARGTLTKATEDLRLAEQNLADAIRQGNQAIEDSIRSAESNLFSIGNTLASTIQEFLDKLGQLGSAATNPASATFKRLRDEIASGTAAPGAAHAAAEIANQIQESQAVQSQSKQKIQQQFADLIDEFNKGAISLATFNKRVAALLAADHISYKKAGQVLGVAFADGFRAQVQGLLAQAAAIAAVPSAKRAGISGLEPSIIRPLETIHQVQEQVAAAQRARDEKALEVAKDQRRLNSLEAAQARVIRQETVQQTRLQKQMEGHLKSIDSETKRRGARDRRLDADRRRRQQQEATSERSYHAKEAHDTAVIGGP